MRSAEFEIQNMAFRGAELRQGCHMVESKTVGEGMEGIIIPQLWTRTEVRPSHLS